jgi:hypothetical protein
MPDPISFSDASPRYRLPFLFQGQTQKEFIVNEAHALLDTLLHPAIEGEASAPPVVPHWGECWLVGANATGDWAGRDGEIACHQPGGWVFVSPRDGMRAFDKESGQAVLFAGSWRRIAAPAPPVGGTTVDIEARASIEEIVSALQQAGILPET